MAERETGEVARSMEQMFIGTNSWRSLPEWPYTIIQRLVCSAITAQFSIVSLPEYNGYVVAFYLKNNFLSFKVNIYLVFSRP